MKPIRSISDAVLQDQRHAEAGWPAGHLLRLRHMAPTARMLRARTGTMVLNLMRGAARFLRSFPGRLRGRESVFTHIYTTNGWRNPESVSGDGSTLRETRVARQVVPAIIARYGLRVLLDIPCGDCNWMRAIDFGGRTYIGADIVADLVNRNQRTFGTPHRRFVHCDVVRDPLPPSDLVLCRDCMIHLSNAEVLEALRNIRRSGARYLLATTYNARPRNVDIITGDWRAINLQAPPFRLPQPIELINEEWNWADGYHADKCLALWETSVLPV